MRKPNSSRFPSSGFSLLELAVVVAVLSILAGISIPAFTNFLKSSRIDQTKAIMNSAIAECLQKYRTDPDTAATAAVPESSLSGLEQAGYKVDQGKDQCNDFMVSPSDPDENYLFQMGFMVRNGKVTKLAIPASDRSSENACKSWGTCGIPPELQAEWDRLAKIEADKKACNDAFYSFLNSGSKGQKNVWDDATQSCSRAQWVLDGTRYTSRDSYDIAFTAKVGKACAETLAQYSSNSPPNGRYKNEACGIDTHFLNGVNLETDDSTLYLAAIGEYQDKQCKAAQQEWKNNNINGEFKSPAGIQCTAMWKCNGQILTSLIDYNSKCDSCTPQKNAMGLC